MINELLAVCAREFFPAPFPICCLYVIVYSAIRLYMVSRDIQINIRNLGQVSNLELPRLGGIVLLKGVGLVINIRSRVRLPDVHCWVSTWMGDRLRAGKPSRYVNRSPRSTQPSIHRGR